MKRNLALISLSSFLTVPAFAAVVYTEGHGDIGVGLEDEGSGPEFHFHVHLGPNATVDGSPVGNAPDGMEYEPGDVIITVGAERMITMPDNAPLNAGTGAAPGSNFWFLPASQEAGTPFLGLATEELEPSDWNSGITFTLTGVTPPVLDGHFSLWHNGTLGEFIFDLSTATGEDSLTLPVGTHAHFNYGFTHPGMWEVTLTVSGEHATAGLMSATETFTFNVVPEPGSALLGLFGVGLLMLRRRRA